jgi:putative PIN family toxin of toxin-antitoxin system
MRIVVDTNVWISAVLTPDGPSGQVRTALRDPRFSLVISEPLIEELVEVLARPRFASRYGITPVEVAELVGFLRERGELAEVSGVARICRDPDDDMVLETVLNGRADAVINRDDDIKGVAELVALLAERGVAVLSVRRFLAVAAHSEGRS